MLGTEFYVGVFFFQHFKYFILFLARIGFWQRSWLQFVSLFCYIQVSFFLWLIFKIFSLCLVFCSLIIICVGTDLMFIPHGILCASWICGLVYVINFGNSWILSLQVFLLLCSFFSSDTPIIYETVSQFLDVLLCFPLPILLLRFFFFFLALHFSLGNYCWCVFKLKILSLSMSLPLMSPSKSFFNSVTIILIVSISFRFFPRISISLPTLSICSKMLSTFSIGALTY